MKYCIKKYIKKGEKEKQSIVCASEGGVKLKSHVSGFEHVKSAFRTFGFDGQSPSWP